MNAFSSLFLFVFCFLFKARLSLTSFHPGFRDSLLKISAQQMFPLSHKGTFSGVLASIVSDHLWNIVRFRLLHHQAKIKYLTSFHLETVLWRNWCTVNITKHSHVFSLTSSFLSLTITISSLSWTLHLSSIETISYLLPFYLLTVPPDKSLLNFPGWRLHSISPKH